MNTLRSVVQLADAGLLPDSDVHSRLESVSARYTVAVTDAVKNCINLKNLPADPVARQFVPDERELIEGENSLVDPIGDDVHSPVRGLVHRYPDRVLLKATQLCPVYCRFCFRRESVGGNAERPLSGDDFEQIFSYIAEHSEIWEVVVSGGDPLVLSDTRLHALMKGLARAPHVKVVRIHTRVPVVNPERITNELIDALHCCNKTLFIAVHANHSNEFSREARKACAKLSDAGIPLVSQTVLLRGVNDSVEALSALMRTFVELRISPYYLHQLDRAPGTEHFRVPIKEGQALLRALRGTWSGLCQPDYVIDLPGGYGKVSIAPSYVQANERGTGTGIDTGNVAEGLSITDPFGRAHDYNEPPTHQRKGVK